MIAADDARAATFGYRGARFVKTSAGCAITFQCMFFTILMSRSAAVAQGVDSSTADAAAETWSLEPGFIALSDGVSFEGWKQTGNWVIEQGAFYRAKNGGSLTFSRAEVPDDFELRFQWKVSQGCNSGVYYRPGQVEYQVLDNVGSPYGENPRQAAASLFFCMAPSKDATRPVGHWNTARVVCQGTVIQHWLNGEKVIDFDYTDPKWADEVELLRLRGGDLTGRGGQLWLQDHGQPIWFRHLRWREIPKDIALRPDPEFRPLPVPPAALVKEQARVRQMLEKHLPAANP